MHNADGFALRLIPLWHGLNVVEEILSPDYEKLEQLEKLRDVTRQRIQEAIGYVADHKSGDRLYQSETAWATLRQ